MVTKKPRVLVLLRVHCDDLRPVDIHPCEDLKQRFLAQPVGDGRVAPPLQEALAAGKLSLSAFSRAWRALERPKPFPVTPPDEIGFRRARKLLAEFGTLPALAARGEITPLSDDEQAHALAPLEL